MASLPLGIVPIAAVAFSGYVSILEGPDCHVGRHHMLHHSVVDLQIEKGCLITSWPVLVCVLAN